MLRQLVPLSPATGTTTPRRLTIPIADRLTVYVCFYEINVCIYGIYERCVLNRDVLDFLWGIFTYTGRAVEQLVSVEDAPSATLKREDKYSHMFLILG